MVVTVRDESELGDSAPPGILECIIYAGSHSGEGCHTYSLGKD